MGSEKRQLHILFFPLMAPGHAIPMVDMAKLFARRGVRASILTTPSNAPAVEASLRRARESGLPVETRLIEFPASKAGLPENLASAASFDMEMEFLMATALVRDPFERLVREERPDAVVTDMFFSWTAEVAEEIGVPRLVFDGTSFFSLCVADAVQRHPPPESPSEDEGPYVVLGLPHRIELSRGAFPDIRTWRPDFAEMMAKREESPKRSYGVIMNSFYELEPEYADHYRKVIGMKAWHVGPVSLCNEDAVDKASRGGSAALDHTSCLSWLDCKEPRSVIYACFGSLTRFTAAQLHEIALGLEASGHPFIWAVRDVAGKGDTSGEWLPEGFEERTAGSGLIIRGWVPQVLLLNHQAIGGFVTHCGWNSCLEGITAGVPMVTWPLFADQFYNQRLLVDVLRVGAPIGGPKRYTLREEERPVVRAEEIGRAVDVVMGGGDVREEMRSRARELKAAARRAVGEGGSSYDDLSRLIDELKGKQSVACHGRA